MTGTQRATLRLALGMLRRSILVSPHSLKRASEALDEAVRVEAHTQPMATGICADAWRSCWGGGWIENRWGQRDDPRRVRTRLALEIRDLLREVDPACPWHGANAPKPQTARWWHEYLVRLAMQAIDRAMPLSEDSPLRAELVREVRERMAHAAMVIALRYGREEP